MSCISLCIILLVTNQYYNYYIIETYQSRQFKLQFWRLLPELVEMDLGMGLTSLYVQGAVEGQTRILDTVQWR